MPKDLTKFHPQPCTTCGHRDMHGEVSGCIAVTSPLGSPAAWCPCTAYASPRPTPATQARARNTDPETSHAAAASLTVDTLRASQAAVLAALNSTGPMTDVSLVEWYTEAAKVDPDYPRQSPSGIRSRRAELTAGGLVEDTGQRVRLESGRQAIVWQAKA